LFGVGLAATATVFWQAFRQIDRSEKQRAQVNRMRNRLNLLLKQRS
jgi:type II secretory pathway component PulJ